MFRGFRFNVSGQRAGDDELRGSILIRRGDDMLGHDCGDAVSHGGGGFFGGDAVGSFEELLGSDVDDHGVLVGTDALNHTIDGGGDLDSGEGSAFDSIEGSDQTVLVHLPAARDDETFGVKYGFVFAGF